MVRNPFAGSSPRKPGACRCFRPAQVIDTTGAGDAFTAGLLINWWPYPRKPICHGIAIPRWWKRWFAMRRLAVLWFALEPERIDPQPDPDAVADFLIRLDQGGLATDEDGAMLECSWFG